jgi:hypothetical protein
MTAFAKSWRDDKAQNSSLRFRASHLRHQWLEAAGERRQRSRQLLVNAAPDRCAVGALMPQMSQIRSWP